MARKDIIKRRKGEVIQEAKIEGESNFPTQGNRILFLVSLLFLFFLLLILLFR